MPNYTQRVTVWAAAEGVTPTGDEVPLAVTLVSPPGQSGIACNIHEGVKEAGDATYLLGIMNVNSAFAFCTPEQGQLVPPRAVLLDPVNLDDNGNHKAWMVRNKIFRTRFQETRHCRLLLTLLVVRPDGLPS